MDIADWSATMSRIAPMLELLKDSSTMVASVAIRGEDNPGAIEKQLDQFPTSHMAGIEATFKRESKDKTMTEKQ